MKKTKEKKARRVVWFYEKIGMVFTFIGLIFASGSEFQYKTFADAAFYVVWFVFWLAIMMAGLCMLTEVQKWEEKHGPTSFK